MAILEEGGALAFTFVSTPPCILLHFEHCRSCALQFQVFCGIEICFHGSLFLRRGFVLSLGRIALALHMDVVGLVAKGTLCLFRYCGQSIGPLPRVLHHPWSGYWRTSS